MSNMFRTCGQVGKRPLLCFMVHLFLKFFFLKKQQRRQGTCTPHIPPGFELGSIQRPKDFIAHTFKIWRTFLDVSYRLRRGIYKLSYLNLLATRCREPAFLPPITLH